jgi:hypothetical protein
VAAEANGVAVIGKKGNDIPMVPNGTNNNGVTNGISNNNHANPAYDGPTHDEPAPTYHS